MRHLNEVFDVLSIKNWGNFEKLKNVKRKLLNYVYIYRTVMNIPSFHVIHLIHLIEKSHFSEVCAF